MADEADDSDAGAEASGAGVDPAAVALALGGADRSEANAYLREQRSLASDQRKFIAKQSHHLDEQFKNLRLNIWEKRFGVLLRIATGFVGVAFAAFLALMIWDAAHADGLIIESFSVPPDMAARGLNGQVVATQMLDKLKGMQTASTSLRSSKSFANNWGDDLQVQIPETGVSVGEAWRFLKNWLGHETHISGEVYRTANGITVTARVGADGGAAYAGAESDLDSLVQKAAEHIYASTQPYRYARYLYFSTPPRVEEARAIFNQLLDGAAKNEKAWALNGLATMARSDEANTKAGVAYEERAMTVDPDFVITYSNLGGTIYAEIGQTEQALAANKKAVELLNRGSTADLDANTVISLRLRNSVMAAAELGDYASAISLARPAVESSGIDSQISLGDIRDLVAPTLARQHDGKAAAAALSEIPPTSGWAGAVSRFRVDAALENWPVVVAGESSVEKTYTESLPRRDYQAVFGAGLRPWLALAKARLGDVAGAENVIGATPADCYDCVRIRGLIAAEAKQWGRADYWFAKAVHDGPSLPFGETDWGQSMLDRGDPDGAIAKFTIANQKGPHFADPLEGWGEALMKKNQSHLALAKFEEADKYAPNWGRLHLKWGEALTYAAKKDEAQKQFTRAAQLDLTADEKAELGREDRK